MSTTGNNDPVPRFNVGDAVKLNYGQTAYGAVYGPRTQTPHNMTHSSDSEIVVEKRELKSPDRYSISPADPGPAKYWTYRLRATLPQTYITYISGKMIDPAKGRVKHNDLSTLSDTVSIADDLIPVKTVVFLREPFVYKEKGRTITLKAGTAVMTAREATTSSGGLSGTVSVENAHYAIRLLEQEVNNYVWRAQFPVVESQLRAA